MALDISSIENAAYYMKHALEKEGFIIEATSAPAYSGTSVDSYRKYIAFTQRVLDKSSTLLCYITYRCTQTTAVKHPQFSSYQVLDVAYKEVTGAKWHLKDSPTPEDCFKTVYDFIKKTFVA